MFQRCVVLCFPKTFPGKIGELYLCVTFVNEKSVCVADHVLRTGVLGRCRKSFSHYRYDVELETCSPYEDASHTAHSSSRNERTNKKRRGRASYSFCQICKYELETECWPRSGSPLSFLSARHCQRLDLGPGTWKCRALKCAVAVWRAFFMQARNLHVYWNDTFRSHGLKARVSKFLNHETHSDVVGSFGRTKNVLRLSTCHSKIYIANQDLGLKTAFAKVQSNF